ncbi:MAG: hypothetical protein GY854_02000 [Deltaproteobacteria bacterium]|nr:hypothetical protein [Deltaproteobacteria bacterium]
MTTIKRANTNRTVQNAICLAMVSMLLLPVIATAAEHDCDQPADASLLWPLWERAYDSGGDKTYVTPRTGAMSTLGEFQYYYSYSDPWGHSGIDFRGYHFVSTLDGPSGGDWVVLGEDAFVWVLAHYDGDTCADSYQCRIYFKGAVVDGEDSWIGRRILYYSHLTLRGSLEDEDGDQDTNARIAIENAAGIWPPPEEVEPGTFVEAGTVIAAITEIPTSEPVHQVHVGIVDACENYDLINPFEMFDYPTGFPGDEEDPTVEEVLVFNAGDFSSPVRTSADTDYCESPISGDVDILAQTTDVDQDGSFYGTDSVGVYKARYTIKRRNSDNDWVPVAGHNNRVWYEFDRLPYTCEGEDRGNSADCVAQGAILDQDGFIAFNYLEHAIQYPDSSNGTRGALHAGLFTSNLFRYYPGSSSGGNCSEYESLSDYLDEECHFLNMTSEWGSAPTGWNTDTVETPDGLYQIGVVAWDAHGNADSSQLFAIVNNGSPDLTVGEDVFMRDHKDDIGAVPSNAGGEKFWKSTDVFVRPLDGDLNFDDPLHGDAALFDSVLLNDTPYEVWVRVRNLGCESATNTEVAIWYADPGTAISEWTPITGTPAERFVGRQVSEGVFEPQTVTFDAPVWFGPFEWTPSGTIHKCFKAAVRSDGDNRFPDESDLESAVYNENGLTQLNITVVGEGAFQWGNFGTSSAAIGLNIDCQDLPMYTTGAMMELRSRYNSSVYNAWLGADDVVVSIEYDPELDADAVVARMSACKVELPPVALSGGTIMPAVMRLEPGDAHECGRYYVDVLQKDDGIPSGGVSVAVGAPCVEVE